MSGFRDQCRAGTPTIGTFVAIPHPVAVEVTAASGVDFVCIDWEHAQIARDAIENLVRAADLHDTPAIVRVPGHRPEDIASALDSGARGVLAPRISSVEHAYAIVMASRYPPDGGRGVGPGRAAGYGYRIFDYLKRANADVLVAAQVETAEGLANIAGIAAVDGIDLIFVGPGDLSVSIGAMGRDGAARLEEAIRTILEAAKAAGKAAGIFCARPEDVARWAAAGATFFILASDTMALGGGVSQSIAASRQALSDDQPASP